MLLFWLTVATLIVGGVLASATLIIAKRPNAKQLIDQLTPIEGIVGCVALGLGIWNLIDIIPNIGGVFSTLRGILLFLGLLCLLGVGFLLAFSIIGKFLGPTGASIASKLAPFKGLMGLVCIGLGVFILLQYIFKF